jgi:hypothetical protein
MSIKKIIPIINELKIIDKNFTAVNAGGCGVVALLISNELTKRNIKHDIVWIGYNSQNVKSVIKKTLKETNNPSLHQISNNGASLVHAMVKIGKDNFIDSTGVTKGFINTQWWAYSVHTKINIELLKSMALNPSGWNTTFNRIQIPKIEKTIKKTLKKLDEVLVK